MQKDMIKGDLPCSLFERNVLFISGIDTNVGKSYATAYLLEAWWRSGHSVITQKMVQTGCEGIAEDVEMHRSLVDQPLLPEDIEGLTSPIVLSYPCSPHMAAKIDNQPIEISKIEAATAALLHKYDTILLEGAGGLMVPLIEDNSPLGGYLTIDYIAEHQYPVVLVSSGRLGSINHTLLSVDACRARGVEVALIVYNHYPSTDELIEASTLEYFARLGIPLVELLCDI